MRDFAEVREEKESQLRQCLSDIAALRRTIELCEGDPDAYRGPSKKNIGEGDVLETEWQNEETPTPQATHQKEVTKVTQPTPAEQLDNKAAKMKMWP